MNTFSSDTFFKTLRFGVIDNGVLIVSSLIGFSLDDVIADKIGQKGYGAIVGAAVGNAISDAMAGIPEGGEAALGYLAGTLAPIVPLGIAMVSKRPLNKGTKGALVASSALMVGAAFMRRSWFQSMKKAAKLSGYSSQGLSAHYDYGI